MREKTHLKPAVIWYVAGLSTDFCATDVRLSVCLQIESNLVLFMKTLLFLSPHTENPCHVLTNSRST